MTRFSPVAKIIASIYDCSPLLVESQAVVFVIMFVPANFVVIKVIRSYGLRVTLIAGALTLTTGAWLRTMVDLTEDFSIVFLGTSISAFG